MLDHISLDQLRAFIAAAKASTVPMAVLGMQMADPTGYGRMSTSGGELAANADRDKPQVRNLPETVTVTTVTEPENGCVSAGARAWVAVTG